MPESKSELYEPTTFRSSSGPSAASGGRAPVTLDIDEGIIVVEAPTAEQALAQVAAQLGDDARIVSAERIQRGGLAGFFAKEMVQITAQSASSAGAAPSPTRTPLESRRSNDRDDPSGAPVGVDRVLDLLSDRVDDREQDFGAALREHLRERRDRPGEGLTGGSGAMAGAMGESASAPSHAAPSESPTWRRPVPVPTPRQSLDQAVQDRAVQDHTAPGRGRADRPITVPTPPRPSTSPRRAAPAAVEHILRQAIADLPEITSPPPEPATPRRNGATNADRSGDPVPGQTHVRAESAAESAIESAAESTTATATATTAAPTTAPTITASPRRGRLAATYDTSVTPGQGAIGWSTDALVHRGVPLTICRSTFDLDPDDDAGWICAIAGAVSPYCRPLPAGSSVIAGPRLDRVAEALDVPLVSYPDDPPYGGSVALRMRTEDAASRSWFDRVRGDRWLHVVAGGPWKDLVAQEPAVVSWVGDDALIRALQLCATYDVGLAYGTLGNQLVRTQPVDVAIALRGLIDRH